MQNVPYQQTQLSVASLQELEGLVYKFHNSEPLQNKCQILSMQSLVILQSHAITTCEDQAEGSKAPRQIQIYIYARSYLHGSFILLTHVAGSEEQNMLPQSHLSSKCLSIQN